MDPTQNQPQPIVPPESPSNTDNNPAPVVITPTIITPDGRPSVGITPLQPIAPTPAPTAPPNIDAQPPVVTMAAPTIIETETPITPTPPVGIVTGGSDTPPPWAAPAQTTPTSNTSADPGASSNNPVQKRRKRKLFIILGGAFALLALISIGVFGLYLPNTPSHVFSTGINRSGKAFDALVSNATDQKHLANLQSSAITGSVLAHVSGSTYSGNFTTSFDKTDLSGGLDITLADKASGSRNISAKVLSELPTGSVYPDVYFQISGLKSLGLDELVPGVTSYDGTWIEADSAYLKSIADQYSNSGGSKAAETPTSADISEFAQATMGVTRDYLFSTSSDKGVFVKKSYIGKEKMDGLNTYHYKVGVNIAHAKAYCVALSDSVISTNAFKKLSGQTSAQITKTKQAAAKNCPHDVDQSLKSSDSFDMWVDGKYKLIHKFRIYDKTDKGTYTDIGQTYTGGDEVSLFSSVHDTANKTDGTFRLNVNVKTNKISGTLAVKGASADNPYDVTATMSSTPSSTPVKITKPANAVKIQDVLSKLGLGSGAETTSSIGISPGSVTTKSQDVQANTNLRALDTQLEASWANNNGIYPTLAQLNSPSWRQQNMSGADSAQFSPTSASTPLASKATSTQFGYVPAGCDASGCSSFTLSALLSDGTTTTLKSF